MSDNKLTAEQVDQQIAARVEQLKSQAVTPAVEPVDHEAARREAAAIIDTPTERRCVLTKLSRASTIALIQSDVPEVQE